MSAVRTAVIGAGLAGLTCARRLAEAGEDVVVFDKARGAGGRTSTRRTGRGGFDHGAQYFTVRSPTLRTRVERWQADGVVAPWEGPFVTLARGQRGPDPRPGRRYVGVPGMNAVAKALAADLSFVTRTRIEAIQPGASGWSLTTDSNEGHAEFDRVIVATPAPQAVPLLAAHSTFAEIVSRARLAPCQAVMVAFEDPLSCDFGGAFVDDPRLSWVAAEASKPGRDARERFVLHATPEWSADHVDDAPESVIAQLVEAFADALAKPLPAPAFAAAHRWLYALPSTHLRETCLWDAEAGLGVCGDWLGGARIEAAVHSGDALADAMQATTR